MSRPGRKRKNRLTDSPIEYAPTFESLRQKAAQLGISRRTHKRKVNGREVITTESDKDFLARLFWLNMHGKLAATESPVLILAHKGIITDKMASAAESLRRDYIRAFGRPEARASSYGDAVDGRDYKGDNYDPIDETRRYYEMTARIEREAGRHVLGHVVNVAVFRRNPTDLPALRRGLEILV